MVETCTENGANVNSAFAQVVAKLADNKSLSPMMLGQSAEDYQQKVQPMNLVSAS